MPDRVAEINHMQAQLTVAASLSDGEQRAEHLSPLVRCGVFPAQQAVLEELGKSGPAAVPVISRMLHDPDFQYQTEFLVDALGEIGGNAAGEELKHEVGLPLQFWKSQAPSLCRGWIEQDREVHASLKQRYSLTYELVRVLTRVRYARALNTVIEVRNLWQSLPQWNDFTEFLEDCDELIHELQAENNCT